MKVWDDRKTKYLLRYYGIKPAREIAEKLRLDLSQVFSQAKRLRNAGYEIKTIKRRWSEAEHAYLKRNYAKKTTDEIAAHIGCTPIEVTSMAGVLRKKYGGIPHKPSSLGRGKHGKAKN